MERQASSCPFQCRTCSQRPVLLTRRASRLVEHQFNLWHALRRSTEVPQSPYPGLDATSTASNESLLTVLKIVLLAYHQTSTHFLQTGRFSELQRESASTSTGVRPVPTQKTASDLTLETPTLRSVLPHGMGRSLHRRGLPASPASRDLRTPSSRICPLPVCRPDVTARPFQAKEPPAGREPRGR